MVDRPVSDQLPAARVAQILEAAMPAVGRKNNQKWPEKGASFFGSPCRIYDDELINSS